MAFPVSVSRLFGVDAPLLQAPMAGSSGVELAVAVAEAGGLGALPCAMLKLETVEAQVAEFRARVRAPVNLNFFCHTPPVADAAREAAWRTLLAPYYAEYNVEAPPPSGALRAPFSEATCALVERIKPEVVSFHFGLPEEALLARVRRAGAKIISSATTLAEAEWLDARGVDAIIAQGAEAGGHRGVFLSEDVATQAGLMALLPGVVRGVRAPVIAAGAIADGRAMAAAFMLGAGAVQIGTAYLRAPESIVGPMHRAALARAGETALTNLFTGRPARGIVNRFMRELGPLNGAALAFPLAANALAPLRAAAEAKGVSDFSPLWAGEAFAQAEAAPAATLTRAWLAEAAALLNAAPGDLA